MQRSVISLQGFEALLQPRLGSHEDWKVGVVFDLMVVVQLLKKEPHPWFKPRLERSSVEPSLMQIQSGGMQGASEFSEHAVPFHPEPAKRAEVRVGWPAFSRMTIQEKAKAFRPAGSTVKVKGCVFGHRMSLNAIGIGEV